MTTAGFKMTTEAGADKVLSSDASGLASWQTPASSAPVSSVFGRTGNVTAASGDYSVGSITGAAPLSSPTFTGTVTVPTPAVAGAAATKGYVDAAGGQGFVGATATTYTGSGVGGYSGGDAKCAATYTDSRMCSAGDFRSTRPNVWCWFSTYTRAVGYTTDADCKSWGSAGTDHAAHWHYNGLFSITTCNAQLKICCCK